MQSVAADASTPVAHAFRAGLVESAVLPHPVAMVDPAAIADLSSPIRAAWAFVLVVLFGAALLSQFEGFVHRSVDASMERPLSSVVYGVVAHGLVVFAVSYAFSQLVRVGAVGRVIWIVGLAILGFALLVLAGLGFVVVGTTLVGAGGERRPWQGLLVGAIIGAVAGFVTPFVVGAAVWVLVVSLGVGGPTRKWIHDTREPAGDPDAEA